MDRVNSWIGFSLRMQWPGVRRAHPRYRTKKWRWLVEQYAAVGQHHEWTLPELLILSSGVHAGSALAGAKEGK